MCAYLTPDYSTFYSACLWIQTLGLHTLLHVFTCIMCAYLTPDYSTFYSAYLWIQALGLHTLLHVFTCIMCAYLTPDYSTFYSACLWIQNPWITYFVTCVYLHYLAYTFCVFMDTDSRITYFVTRVYLHYVCLFDSRLFYILFCVFMDTDPWITYFVTCAYLTPDYSTFYSACLWIQTLGLHTLLHVCLLYSTLFCVLMDTDPWITYFVTCVYLHYVLI